MKRSIVASLSAFFVFVFSLVLQAQGVTVSPTRLFFSGEPGTIENQTVTMKNDTALPVSFSVGFNDWYRDANGQKLYFAPNTLPHSNSSWIKASEKTVTIAPGATKELVITMTVPAKLKSETVTNSMLMLTQIARQEDQFSKEKSIGIKILFEFALHVFHTPKANTTEDLDFTKYSTRCKSIISLLPLEISAIASFSLSYRDWETDRKSTRLNSSHSGESRMPSSA